MNDEQDIEYKMNFDFIVPKEYCTSFQNIFSYIKKKYQVKFSRKSQIDSLLKKCKGKFFKTIHEVMNKCLNIVVKRLPQFFITNITIEYNKKYMGKTVIQIYQEFNDLPDYKSLQEQNFIISNKEKLFDEFCSYSLYNLYDIYCESRRYNKDIKGVKAQDGKRIGLLYEFVSLNFSAYYKYNKPHFAKNKEISSQNSNNESSSKFIEANDKNEGTNFNKKSTINFKASYEENVKVEDKTL